MKIRHRLVTIWSAHHLEKNKKRPLCTWGREKNEKIFLSDFLHLGSKLQRGFDFEVRVVKIVEEHNPTLLLYWKSMGVGCSLKDEGHWLRVLSSTRVESFCFPRGAIWVYREEEQ